MKNLEAPLAKLNLSPRVYNALRRHGIATARELQELFLSGGLPAVRGLGKQGESQCRAMLLGYGIPPEGLRLEPSRLAIEIAKVFSGHTRHWQQLWGGLPLPDLALLSPHARRLEDYGVGGSLEAPRLEGRRHHGTSSAIRELATELSSSWPGIAACARLHKDSPFRGLSLTLPQLPAPEAHLLYSVHLSDPPIPKQVFAAQHRRSLESLESLEQHLIQLLSNSIGDSLMGRAIRRTQGDGSTPPWDEIERNLNSCKVLERRGVSNLMHLLRRVL